MTETASPSNHGWIWPILLAVTIFAASGQSAVAAPDIISIDKIGHFGVFGLLGVLIARTQSPSRWWLGFVLASLYGMCDEWRQSFTPGRSVEFADWIADTLGAALAVTLYSRWSFFRETLEIKIGRRPVPSVAKSGG
ncbi:VanZ family protein [Opitutaceae bacterium]|nr:VanZ family protein [Opitutaceae bacterium]